MTISMTGADVNVRVMSALPGFRYSSVAADGVARHATGERLTVNPSTQIARRNASVVLRRGLAYSGKLRLDLHVPVAQGRYPLVVYLPGGGFVVAPRRMAARQRAFVAAAGYAVASVEYRTTRQGATCADGLVDIHAVIGYLTDRADEYRIDPRRVGIWGESAGGYLASLAGLTDARIRAVVDLFGGSDLTRVADGFDSGMQAATADLRHPIHRYRAADANPIELVRPDAPPFLLLHGDDDRIISPVQTLLLHQALLDAGVESTHYLVAGAGHGRLSLNRHQAQQWTTIQVMTIVKEFLDRHLRGC